MQKANRLEKRKTILWLLLIYICSVAVRYILALATKNFPTVYIDEYLYYSLGRSIATKGSLLLYGQPAEYNYIIYPLVLSPIYLLFSHGTNYFRAIQLWNILIMSLSVFPIYGLCNAIVQKRKTALWLTGLFMALPCFILGEFVFSEAVIYPLFYTLMYCVYRYLREDKIKYTVWTGILGALLYHTKPGAVVPAVLALLLFGGKAIRKKSGRNGVQVLAGLGCLAVLFLAIKLIAEQVLGYSGVLLSVYDYQASFAETIGNEYFFRTLGKYPYYYILAGGILPTLVSVWRFPEYDREDKQYYLLVILSSLLTMIGTAWVANRPEEKNILFLRYVEMYLPILFVFSIRPERESREISGRARRTTEVLCFMLLAYVTACTVIWGSTTGIGEAKETHFLISLAALFTRNVMGIANIIVIFLAGLTLFLLFRKTERQTMTKACSVILVVLAIVNNLEAYLTTGRNTNWKLEEETTEIHQLIGDKEFVYVYAADQCDYGLDINSRQNICWVTEADFMNCILRTHGYYSPFVPSSSRGMNAINETPDTDLLIVSENIYQKYRFSKNTSKFISSQDSFEVVRFPSGARIVDCVLTKVTTKEGAKDTYALIVYNEEWLTHPVKISLEIESPVDQEIVISADTDHTAALKAGRFTYEIGTSNPVTEYFISVKDSDVQFHDFSITAITATE